MNKSTTAMQLHIKMMKMHLEHMQIGTIQFATLLKLIKEANDLLDLERLQIEQAYMSAYLDTTKGAGITASQYYEEKYEAKTETKVS